MLHRRGHKHAALENILKNRDLKYNSLYYSNTSYYSSNFQQKQKERNNFGIIPSG